MEFKYNQRTSELLDQIQRFMQEHLSDRKRNLVTHNPDNPGGSTTDRELKTRLTRWDLESISTA